MLLAADSGGLLPGADLSRGHRRAEVEEPWLVSGGSNVSSLLTKSVYLLVRLLSGLLLSSYV